MGTAYAKVYGNYYRGITMSIQLEHALNLIENHGSCNGDYIRNCDECFVPKLADYFDDCSMELAYECAEKFLAEAEGRGICISIW